MTRNNLILWSILAVGFILRLIGIGHGLPGIYHPDEPIVVSRAINAVINGDLNPKFFHWPGFLIYLLALEYEIIYLIGRLFDTFSSTEDFFKLYSISRGDFHLWGRLLVALMSTGIGYYVFLTLRIWKNYETGLCGLFLCTINLMLIKHGQFITPDVPALFFATICIYYLAKYYFRGRKVPDIFLAAIMAGLATATKYNYALMLVPILIQIFTSSDLKITKRFLIAAVSGIITLGVFLVFNPFIILDFKTFLFQFNEISIHLKEGHIGMEAGGHPSWKIIQYLIDENGILFFVLALSGIFLDSKSNRLWIITILSFPVLVLISHGRWDVTADRYALPSLLALMPLCLVTITMITSTKANQWKSLRWILVGLTICQISFLSTAFFKINLQPDNREIAHKWINNHILVGSTIVIEKDGPDLRCQHAGSKYHNNPAYYFIDLTPWYGTSFRTEKTPMETLIENKPDYVIINSGVYSRYEPGAPSQTEFPEIYKVWNNYYDFLKSTCEPVYDTPTETSKTTGPKVIVYKIPEKVWDTLVPVKMSNPDETQTDIE
jgi:hypothetical protein